MSRELSEDWAAEYERQTGNDLVVVKLGTYAYVFDIEGERLVCATGCSTAPDGPRDASRQRGHPPAPRGDHKGHVFAHSMGGGMDINIVPQPGSCGSWSAASPPKCDRGRSIGGMNLV